MDWGRAKNIILAVLVITNIFLIAVYGLRYEHTRENNAELREYTIEKLTENRIELECEIPEKPGKIPALTVQYETYDSAEVEEAIKEEQKDVQSGKHDRPESREEYQRAAAFFCRSADFCSRKLFRRNSKKMMKRLSYIMKAGTMRFLWRNVTWM